MGNTFTFTPLSPGDTNPVSLADMKAHLRIDPSNTDDDATIQAYLDAALNYVETETRQQLLTRSYVMAMDDFPRGHEGYHHHSHHSARELHFSRPPLQSVTAFTYRDPTGTLLTLDSSLYVVDTITVPGRLVLKPAQAWPETDRSAGNVQITYVAGYADASLIPAGLIQCIKLLAASSFENREGATDRTITAVPLAVESLLQMNSFPEAVG